MGADFRHCPLPFSGFPGLILSPSRGRASSSPGLSVLHSHTPSSWKHLEQLLLNEKEILSRRGHKPRAHLKGRVTRLGCLGILAKPLSSLPRKVTCVRGTRSKKDHTTLGGGWAGWREGRTEEEGWGCEPGWWGPTESGRERFCSPVSCLLLVGPMQELDPHLHPAEARREELRLPRAESGLRRAGKDQSGTTGQPGTVKPSLHFSQPLENQKTKLLQPTTSCSAHPCQFPPKASSETR